MEITATEQDIEKRMKRNEDSLRDLWTVNAPVFALYGSQYSHYTGPRTRRERTDQRKIFEDIIAENLPNMGKEIVNHVQEAESQAG